MDLNEFKKLLHDHSDHEIVFQFDNGQSLAPHFHVTEVGKITKDFVDCGGTRRAMESCMLQTLVADDIEHRLTCGKLAGILDKASVLGIAGDSPVEAEVQTDTISIYSVSTADGPSGSVTTGTRSLAFKLSTKQTACLAPDRCGLDVVQLGEGSADCDSQSGCC